MDRVSYKVLNSLRKACEKMAKFTHFDEDGNAVMVDISGKQPTVREALAEGRIKMSDECYQAVRQGGVKKGDVLAAARLSGIMAVKQTAGLIPLCHALLIEKAAVDFVFDDEKSEIIARCRVKTTGATGVEMEAMVGVSIALLTIYDMCKAVDKNMEISSICLVEKTGGKSGTFQKQRS